jgi:hypothetical protein
MTVMIYDLVGEQYSILHPQAKMAQVVRIPATQSGATLAAPRQPPVPPPEPGLPYLLMGSGAASDTNASGQARINPPSTLSLGEKEIEGLTTTGTRWEQTFAAGTIGNDKPITVTVEQWYSADLGVVVSALQRTSTGTELTYRLHNIARSEPDSALFAIPADYTRNEGQTGVISATATRKD